MMTREEIALSIKAFRETPEAKKLDAQREADRRAMMERRAKYSSEELERLDREAMRKIEAWQRGDMS